MTKPKEITLLTALCLFLVFSAGAAEHDPCALLTTAEKGRVNEALNLQHCYDCCDLTLAECLDQRPRCRLATRLENFVCRLVEKGFTCPEVEKALYDRGLSMIETAVRRAIDPETASRVGEAGSPVKVALYTCVRCPFCSKLFPPLYEEVVRGELKGKVELLVKIFPIKGHPYSVEAGLAAMAAREQGRMAEFFLYAYENFDDFKVENLSLWAERVGLDMEKYQQALEDTTTWDMLVAVKREGYANKVRATPVLFINGRRYQGIMDRETLIDVMLEEYDKMRGDIYE